MLKKYKYGIAVIVASGIVLFFYKRQLFPQHYKTANESLAIMKDSNDFDIQKAIIKTQVYEWLDRINKEEQLPHDIIAFNFGLFENPTGYSLYLTGSKVYDPNDDNWAMEVNYTPLEKYLYIKNNSKEKINWDQFLKIITNIITSYTQSEGFKTSFLKKSHAITVGFDDGDLVRIN